MQKVTVDDIKRDPLKYLNQVEAGESFVIIQADKAIAELDNMDSQISSYKIHLNVSTYSYCLLDAYFLKTRR